MKVKLHKRSNTDQILDELNEIIKNTESSEDEEESLCAGIDDLKIKIQFD